MLSLFLLLTCIYELLYSFYFYIVLFIYVLRAYLDEYKLLPEMQSAYRQFHSTETALIKVFNGVLLAVDKGQEAVVFSAAFDSIDHTIMTDRFQRCYGIKGTVLKWLISCNRKQCIVVNGSLSKLFLLPWGFRRGL